MSFQRSWARKLAFGLLSLYESWYGWNRRRALCWMEAVFADIGLSAPEFPSAGDRRGSPEVD